MGADRVECLNPVKGKASVHIDRWKYDRLRQLILAILPAEAPGVRFADLPGLIAERLDPDERDRLGSVSWYTTSVKLDLEARGEIRRLPKVSPQELVLMDPAETPDSAGRSGE
ncbi:MAG TPA: hypothetical protein VGA52_00055 [Anaerolineales bacterium]|jgi:hypothetical protein